MHLEFCSSSSRSSSVEVVNTCRYVDVLAMEVGGDGGVPVVVTWRGAGIGGRLFIVVVVHHPPIIL